MDNENTKILLTINLEGGALIRQSEPTNMFYKHKGKKHNFKHYSLKQSDCTMKININHNTYKYWISNEAPYSMKLNVWNKMKPEDKVIYHCTQLMRDYNGKSFKIEYID